MHEDLADSLFEVKPQGKWSTIGERKAWSDAVRAVAKVVCNGIDQTEAFYRRAGMYGDDRDLRGPSSP